MTTITDSIFVEYCDGLCINPESIKIDALRLMSYSNSINSLRARASECSVTGSSLDQNMFTEVLSLVVTLALRCRLWNDSYRRTLNLKDVENSKVGIRRTGSKVGKPIKLREVTSFISHASGFWFDPIEIPDYKTGVNFSISVPPDDLRVSKFNSSVEMVISELANAKINDDDRQKTVQILQELVREDKKEDDLSERIYTINLDEFACGVCLVVDHCHSCAGEAGVTTLKADGLPDKSAINFRNLSGWLAEIEMKNSVGELESTFIGVDANTADSAIDAAKSTLEQWSVSDDSQFRVVSVAEYFSGGEQLQWHPTDDFVSEAAV